MKLIEADSWYEICTVAMQKYGVSFDRFLENHDFWLSDQLGYQKWCFIDQPPRVTIDTLTDAMAGDNLIGYQLKVFYVPVCVCIGDKTREFNNFIVGFPTVHDLLQFKLTHL